MTLLKSDRGQAQTTFGNLGLKVKGISAICILLIATLWAWSQSTLPSTPDAQPSISEVATNFTHYEEITKERVLVNPELAMLCMGASKEQVDAARIKFGPHANTAILVYMNKHAADAFRTNATAYPVGAVVVKQKMLGSYRDHDGKWVHPADTGVGGMVKRPAGYDPGHSDWEYFYFEDPKKIESGHISSCVQCHEAAKSKDYVFGTWDKTGD
jgi:hypothetical protein